MASSVLIAPPPKDTAFFDKTGRISSVWLAWLNSIVSTGAIVQTLAAAPPPVAAASGSVATGSAIVNFGAAPGTNQVSVTVTGQTAILATSTIACFFMGDATATHNIEEHLFAEINLRASAIVPGVGFTINAVTEWRLSGTFEVRWTWS